MGPLVVRIHFFLLRQLEDKGGAEHRPQIGVLVEPPDLCVHTARKESNRRGFQPGEFSLHTAWADDMMWLFATSAQSLGCMVEVRPRSFGASPQTGEVDGPSLGRSNYRYGGVGRDTRLG